MIFSAKQSKHQKHIFFSFCVFFQRNYVYGQRRFTCIYTYLPSIVYENLSFSLKVYKYLKIVQKYDLSKNTYIR